MIPLAWLLLASLALIILVVFEGKRQERKYGPSQGGGLMRPGLLELQRHLQPDRKVEILLERRETSVQTESGEGGPGETDET